MKESDDAIELSNEIKKVAEPKINESHLEVFTRREFIEDAQGKYIELKFIIQYTEK